MRRWGLLGSSLSHSFSPGFFQAKFQAVGLKHADYELFERSNASAVRELFEQHPELEGLNVTVPHKTAVIPYLDELTPVAQAIGAVNTIRRMPDGRLLGHNTDAEGFAGSLRPFLTGDHDRAMILGAGGAASAVRHALQELGIEVVHLVRNAPPKDVSFRWVQWEDVEAAAVRHYRLIVQATPVGTAPHVDESVPFPWEGVGPRHLVVDLIYNPAETAFLKMAAHQGALTLNGGDMLTLQAEAAWKFWTSPT